ncbi:MAG: carboxypeptidase-like regulatory domain-containing protein [Planctomycetota bacterium]
MNGLGQPQSHSRIKGDSLRCPALFAAVSIAVFVVVVAILFIRAQLKPEMETPWSVTPTYESENMVVTGTVVDANGQVVPKASVFVRGGDFSSFDQVSADEQGNFEVLVKLPSWDVVPQTEVFFHSSHSAWRSVWLNGVLDQLPRDEQGRFVFNDVTVPLPPGSQIEVYVTDENDKPVENASVYPQGVYFPSELFSDDPGGVLGILPAAIRDAMAKRTGPRGRATLERVDDQLLYSLAVEAEGYGKQTIQWRSARNRMHVRLSPTMRIEGRTVGDRSSFAGQKICVATRTPSRRPSAVSSSIVAEIERDGTFEIPHVAESKDMIFRMFSGGKPRDYFPVFRWERSVDSEGTVRVEVEAVPTHTLNGLLLAKDTRQPIRNAWISVSSNSVPSESHRVITDDRGRFSAKVPFGEVSLAIIRVEDFVRDFYDIHAIRHTFEFELYGPPRTFVITPKRSIMGVLLDGDDQPISNASIGVITSMKATVRAKDIKYPSKTNSKGEFKIRVDWTDWWDVRNRRNIWFMNELSSAPGPAGSLVPLDVAGWEQDRVVIELDTHP